MKKIICLLLLLSCTNNVEKFSDLIKVNYASIGKNYGKTYKIYNLTRETFKFKDYTMFVYIDKNSFKKIDTVKVYKNKKVLYNNNLLEKIDVKKVTISNKTDYVYKFYLANIGNVSTDNFAGEIFYINKNGIVARYGLISNYISLYEPNLYIDLHQKILHREIAFKRHKEELEGLP